LSWILEADGQRKAPYPGAGGEDLPVFGEVWGQSSLMAGPRRVSKGRGASLFTALVTI
jgi:hypothetical protein